ncbi:hypothetical protein HELRODRAFT_183643 [Helobdella robusta]|uniref:Neurotransmitter-gated ion-channel ligand-binding domain-containing protein n=1 Tax=Helobdella robusta TaxID=6412 RepID=T1FJZ4_HELRO|nr:hypothetical protein HELRODRAFT_183643 [Helobdella robusta]ESO10421.1 hypothetical protein HELRODRAFT_183643 [Helobdella robusta]
MLLLLLLLLMLLLLMLLLLMLLLILIDCFHGAKSKTTAPIPKEIVKDGMVMIDLYIGNISFMHFNQEDSTAFIRFEMTMVWEDSNLQWNKDVYLINSTVLPSDSIWTPQPELFLENANRLSFQSHSYKVKIQNNGLVRWVIDVDTVVFCGSRQFRMFPFDWRRCLIRLDFSHFDNHHIGVRLIGVGQLVSRNLEWKPVKENPVEVCFGGILWWSRIVLMTIQNQTLKQKFKLHSPYQYVYLTLRRVPTFYNYLVITPSVIILLFLLFVLWQRSSSCQSLPYTQRFNNYFQRDASKCPSFVLHLLLFEMVLVLITFIIAIITYNMYYNDYTSQVPQCLKMIFFNPVVRLLTSATLPPVDMKITVSRDQPNGANKPTDPFLKTMDSFNKFLAYSLNPAEIPATHAQIVRNDWRQLAYAFERLFSILLSATMFVGLLAILPVSSFVPGINTAWWW